MDARVKPAHDEYCVRYGPGSAAHHHSAPKTRVNALMVKNGALRCVRGTELLLLREV
jgi:hypothetical protein